MVNILKINLADAITGLRVLLSPMIFFNIISDRVLPGLTLYLVALLSDLLDGYVARKTNTVSTSGAFFDVSADFLLAISGITSCIMLDRLNYLVLIVSILMFAQFIAGFGGRIVYDPFGKLFGIIILICTPFILVGPSFIGYLINSSILFLGLGSLVGRQMYLGDSFQSTVHRRGSLRHLLSVNGLNR